MTCGHVTNKPLFSQTANYLLNSNRQERKRVHGKQGNIKSTHCNYIQDSHSNGKERKKILLCSPSLFAISSTHTTTPPAGVHYRAPSQPGVLDSARNGASLAWFHRPAFAFTYKSRTNLVQSLRCRTTTIFTMPANRQWPALSPPLPSLTDIAPPAPAPSPAFLVTIGLFFPFFISHVRQVAASQ